MARKRKSKRKSPSRIRYEEKTKVISFRANKEFYDSLEAVKKVEGKSTADLLKERVGIREEKIRAESEIRKEAYEKGLKEGYRNAETKFKVTYLCKVCKKPIEITSPKAKEAVSEYMLEHGWGHADCHNKKRK